MFEFTFLSIFSVILLGIGGYIWLGFVFGNAFLLASYMVGKKVKLFNEYRYKTATAINLVLSIMYFILLLVDIIM